MVIKRRTVIAIGAVVMVFYGGQAFGALTGREGGPIQQIVVVRNDLPTTSTSTEWVDLPGATATVSGTGDKLPPAGSRRSPTAPVPSAGYCAVPDPRSG